MEIDQTIYASLNNLSETSGCRIFKVKQNSSDFYYKLKPIKTLSKTLSLPKLGPAQAKQSSIFMTQLSSLVKPKKSALAKILSICAKNKEDRLYSEVIMVTRWLSDVFFFSPIAKIKLQLLAKNIAIRHYKYGEYLFREGEALATLFIVFHGEVDVFYKGKKVDRRGLRDVVGENSLIAKENSLYAAKAATELDVFYIHTAHFFSILGSDHMATSIETLKLLRNIDLFSQVRLLKLIAYSNKLQPLKIKKKIIIYNYSEPSHSFYVLAAGLVHEKFSLEGNHEFINEVKPGERFGSRDFIINCQRRSVAIAAANSVIYQITKDAFGRLIKDSQYFEYEEESSFESFWNISRHGTFSRTGSREIIQSLSYDPLRDSRDENSSV